MSKQLDHSDIRVSVLTSIYISALNLDIKAQQCSQNSQ